MGISPAQANDRPLSQHWIWAIAIAAIAFLIRLVPVLRGGGLFGIGNYDDGVYYAAATALIHGLLPYQDFLFLHPPGSTLLLAPFGAVAQLIGDSYGFAVARLGWMLLGAANAVLIWRILRPIGGVAALFGGFGYAVLYPAAYAEKSTLLEGPATTALLIAMVLLEPVTHAGSLTRGRAFAAGALLGLATTIKIWGALTLLIVLGWLLLERRFRAALHVMIASAVSVTIICLPFFVAAPTAMWNQIVRDQFFRRRRVGITIFDRLQESAGLGLIERSLPGVVVVAAVTALLCAAALAWTYREARLAVLLLIVNGTFLLITPVWFLHFAAYTAAPLALTVGAAIDRLTVMVRAGPARLAIISAFAVALLVYTSGWATVSFNRRFPEQFKAFTASTPGCVTSDDQTTLVVTDSLSRNLKRGCRFIADLGGHSHDLSAASGRSVTRNRNQAFQRFALSYLRSGSVTILIRYRDGRGFNARTTAVLDQWPLLARSGGYQVRQPLELGSAARRESPTPQRR
ncbi:MAG TPA: glycosyltransferase 87 family protein [Propionibacteriaceae bacterium]|nr:glycosyltransferase 87 family protein [Propionibacteriaceae bacterium]